MNREVLEATEAMVVVMQELATEYQIEKVVARLVEMGMDVHRSTGVTRTVLGAVRAASATSSVVRNFSTATLLVLHEHPTRCFRTT